MKSGTILRTLLIVLLVGMSLVVVGRQIKVVHVALGNYGDHWVQLVTGAKEMAKKLGIDLTVLDAQMSNNRQVQMLNNAISMKPDAIFIDHGEGAALTPGIKRAMSMGIPVIIFDVITNADVTCDISQDDYMLAYKSLSKLAEDIGGKGNIVVVTLSGIAPLERRMRILPLILERFKQIKVIETIAPPFSSAVISDTLTRMQAVLRAHPEEDAIQAIWAPYDQLAIGALKAVQQDGRKIPIYSVDVSMYDLKLMAEPGSVWKATAACDPSEIGRVAMRVAYLAATGQTEAIPRYAIIPAALITQEVARSLDLKGGEYLTKELVPAWGDSGLAWTPQLREMVK
ncbi:MAG: simple sugar transport system substrate-binding protein [Anaerophaga sp.]|nr:simple sugar transport system substrate-binding protein [Anaerophaga sp.]